MSSNQKTTSILKEYDGQIVTALSILITLALAVWAYRFQDALITCITVAALGGIVHEIAQSGGAFVMPGKSPNDPMNVYLGSLYGLIAGGIAGLLLVSGQNLVQATQSISTTLLSEAFLAGLGLKGISEAVADQTQQRPLQDQAQSG